MTLEQTVRDMLDLYDNLDKQGEDNVTPLVALLRDRLAEMQREMVGARDEEDEAQRRVHLSVIRAAERIRKEEGT